MRSLAFVGMGVGELVWTLQLVRWCGQWCCLVGVETGAGWLV